MSLQGCSLHVMEKRGANLEVTDSVFCCFLRNVEEVKKRILHLIILLPLSLSFLPELTVDQRVALNINFVTFGDTISVVNFYFVF